VIARAQQTYYAEAQFADAFASLARAPETVRGELASVPGVDRVETRLVAQGTLRVASHEEPGFARLVSLPPSPVSMNQVHVRQGRLPIAGRAGEALVSEAFFQAHGLRLGDSIELLVHGRDERLRVVGVGLSPEYVFAMRPEDVMPNDRRFGVFWLERSELERMLGFAGAFNDVLFAFARGAREGPALAALDRVLKPYGGVGAFGRDAQVSHRYLTDNIAELESVAVAVPCLFLLVTVALLNMVVSRLIGAERREIAILKALGYRSGTLVIHYLKLVTVPVFLGASLGVLLGDQLGRAGTQLYGTFFRFPQLTFELAPRLVGLAVALAVLGALIGVLRSVLAVTRVAPAEAMRPAPPEQAPRMLASARVLRALPATLRMSVRNLLRAPMRSAASVAGVALATALIVVSAFFQDAMDHVVRHQFQAIHREDATLAFASPVSGGVRSELERLPGVLRAEPFRTAALRVRSGLTERRVPLLAVEPASGLFPMPGLTTREARLPERGLVLTDKLARVLRVHLGDRITLLPFTPGGAEQTAEVVGIFPEYLGMSVYASAAYARELLGEREALWSGAFLRTDPAHYAALCQRVQELPKLASFDSRVSQIAAFEATSKRYLLVCAGVLLVFAVVVVAAVIYNSSRVLLAERTRELATLRLLGFERRQVATMLVAELGCLSALAILPGLALGYLSAAGIAAAYDWELYRVPLVVEPSTFVSASGTVVLATLISALLVRRKLATLSFEDALKNRE
jgi:putative ABC transport system permease protein